MVFFLKKLKNLDTLKRLFNYYEKKSSLMFEPRKPVLTRCHKNRRNGLASLKMQNIYTSGGFDWPGIFSLGQGQLTLKALSTLFIWAKKLSKFPKKTRRFWFNLQRNTPITKKPKNSRMGKGKGKRITTVAIIKAGVPLLKLSLAPFGVFKKLKTKIQVRCGFKVGLRCLPQGQGAYVGFYANEVKFFRIRQFFIGPIREEFHTQFKYLNKPWLNFYFFDFFKWRYIVPYALAKKRKGARIKRKQWAKLLRHRVFSLTTPQGMGFARQLLSIFKQESKKPKSLPVSWWQDFYVDMVPKVWTDYLANPECTLTPVPGTLEDRFNFLFLSDPDLYCILLEDYPTIFIYKTHPDDFFLDIHTMPYLCGFEFFEFYYCWYVTKTKEVFSLIERV